MLLVLASVWEGAWKGHVIGYFMGLGVQNVVSGHTSRHNMTIYTVPYVSGALGASWTVMPGDIGIHKFTSGGHAITGMF